MGVHNKLPFTTRDCNFAQLRKYKCIKIKMETTKETTFSSLKIDDWLIKQCQTLGVTKPTQVQIQCIPPILEGRDCIGCDKTGSGKTFAFALPMVQTLSKDPYGIFALVLTPTRELAYQIADQFQVVGKPIGLRLAVIVGGMDMMTQGAELARSPHIVISTPGRLFDHLNSCHTFSLKSIKYLVMDEADRLLEGKGNFDEQLKRIFEELPKNKQTLLFSATITDTLKKLQEVALNNPFMWEAPVESVTVDTLDQRYLLTPPDVKDGYLVHVVQKFRNDKPKGSIIVFTDTCKSCQILCMTLAELGFESLALHSMISQRDRIAALTRFRSNTVRILIATDVASRGLDIPSVELVVNHNVPTAPKEYVHRVGRTARAGRGGFSLTLISQHDIKLLHAIEAILSRVLITGRFFNCQRRERSDEDPDSGVGDEARTGNQTGRGRFRREEKDQQTQEAHHQRIRSRRSRSPAGKEHTANGQEEKEKRKTHRQTSRRFISSNIVYQFDVYHHRVHRNYIFH